MNDTCVDLVGASQWPQAALSNKNWHSLDVICLNIDMVVKAAASAISFAYKDSQMALAIFVTLEAHCLKGQVFAIGFGFG